MMIKFLCDAFCPPLLIGVPTAHLLNTRCALSGEEIPVGYPVASVVAKATADFADTFRTPSAWLSEEAARLFKANTLMRGNLLALPGRGLRPFVALASATEERPAWRDLLRQIAPGTQTVAIITDNHKRRLWPQARLSRFGEAWRPLFVVGDEERSLCVDVARLRECLDMVEFIYGLGFTKAVIRDGLVSVYAKKAIRAVGLARAQELEAALREWRGSDEFALAVFVAQKFVAQKKEVVKCHQMELL